MTLEDWKKQYVSGGEQQATGGSDALAAWKEKYVKAPAQQTPVSASASAVSGKDPFALPDVIIGGQVVTADNDPSLASPFGGDGRKTVSGGIDALLARQGVSAYAAVPALTEEMSAIKQRQEAVKKRREPTEVEEAEFLARINANERNEVGKTAFPVKDKSDYTVTAEKSGRTSSGTNSSAPARSNLFLNDALTRAAANKATKSIENGLSWADRASAPVITEDGTLVSRSAALAAAHDMAAAWEKDLEDWQTAAENTGRGGNFGGREKKTDVGQLAEGMLVKGADEAMYGIASTLDWVNRALKQGILGWTPEEYDNTPTATSEFKHYLERNRAANVERYAENASGSKAAKLADEIGTATVAAVPQAVLALMTAGASLEAQATTAGLQAASAAAGATGAAGLANTVGTALRGMAKDPQYWLSFLQVAGNNYEEARADGASDLAASSYALLNGLTNALVEVGGGGIQELPANLQRGGRSALMEWVTSALDEGKEEVVQGVIERGLQNLVYGKNNPLFSTEDENAVFNPLTSAKEFGMGAAVGGILGGGQTLAQSAVNRAGDLSLPSPEGFSYDEWRSRGMQEAVAADVQTVGNVAQNAAPTEGTAGIKQRFAADLDQWLGSTTETQRAQDGGRFLIGHTSENLRQANVDDYDIYFGKSKIARILRNIEMTPQLIKEVADVIENPVIVMDSKTVPGSITMFGDSQTANGKPVMVSMLLHPTTKTGEILDYGIVTSAYGRRTSNAQNLIDTSSVRYIDPDTKRTGEWMKALGLQLPSASSTAGIEAKGAADNPPTRDRIVRPSTLSSTVSQPAQAVKPEYTGMDGTMPGRGDSFSWEGWRRVGQERNAQLHEDWMNSVKTETNERPVETRQTLAEEWANRNETLAEEAAWRRAYDDELAEREAAEVREATKAAEDTNRQAEREIPYQANADSAELVVSADDFIDGMTQETERVLSAPAEAETREDRAAQMQRDIDEYWEMAHQQANAIADENARQSSPEDMVSAGTAKQRKGVKRSAQDAWSYFKRKMVDSGEAVTRIGKAVGDEHLYPYYNMARASSNAAVSMITDAATDIRGRRTGKSLNDVFKPVMEKGNEYYKQFQLYLYHMHNIDRMTRYNQNDVDRAALAFEDFQMENPELARFAEYQIEKIAQDPDNLLQPQAQEYISLRDDMRKTENTKNKPVFGYDVSAADSSAAAEKLLRDHPEFEALAQEVYDYRDNLMRYRVDSGLITEDEYEYLKAIYPHYVPTYRVMERTRPGRRQTNRVTIGKTVGRATGGTEKLMPLHKALAMQTMNVVREGSKNRFGQRLMSDIEKTSRNNAAREHVLDIQDYSGDFHEDTFDDLQPKNTIFYKDNTFVVRDGGQMYEMTVSPALYEAVQALSPNSTESNIFTKTVRKGNDLFKKLVTGYNPVFLIRNFIRDAQDAALYSKDLSKLAANFPQAYHQIRTNGEYWQMFKALGGTYSSIFDYETGNVDEGNWVKRNVIGRVEALNEAVEQAPRLAEFMATVKKNGGLDAGMDTLMDAMYNAADVTVNFGRSGTLGKTLNANYIPFLNPGIQGFDKMVRAFTETKGAKDWLRLIAKCALFGFAPAVINGLIYRDDDEWDQLKQRDKDVYYLFKIKDGLWLKIPKGRTLSVLGMTADRAGKLASGEDVNWGGFIETAASQTAPANPLSENILKAWFDADLLNRESPGRTWYGTDIESQRLQNYAPGERYDAKTDDVSKWLGGQLNLSPKKINYLLDQYSGVVGDILLPLLTPTAERDMFSAAFTLDSVASNRLNNDFYETADELTYAKNGKYATGTDKVVYKFWNKQSSDVSEINAAIREIEADPSLGDSEKRDELHDQYGLRNALEQQALGNLDAYKAAAQKAYDAAADIEDEDDRVDYAYLTANREVFGAEYAIKASGKKDYEKAQEMEKEGLSFETFFDIVTAGGGTATAAGNYQAYCSRWLDVADFVRYYSSYSNFHDIKDENGKTIVRKMDQVIEYIDALSVLTYDQKSALFAAFGYAQSRLKYCPWWNEIQPHSPDYPW